MRLNQFLGFFEWAELNQSESWPAESCKYLITPHPSTSTHHVPLNVNVMFMDGFKRVVLYGAPLPHTGMLVFVLPKYENKRAPARFRSLRLPCLQPPPLRPFALFEKSDIWLYTLSTPKS